MRPKTKEITSNYELIRAGNVLRWSNLKIDSRNAHGQHDVIQKHAL